MRTKNLWMLAAILICGAMSMLTSCSDSDSVDDITQPEIKPACITDTIRSEKKKATVYNIEYPSTDPFGNPVTLSGSIIIGDEVVDDGKKAAGTVLYNHFTGHLLLSRSARLVVLPITRRSRRLLRKTEKDRILIQTRI